MFIEMNKKLLCFPVQHFTFLYYETHGTVSVAKCSGVHFLQGEAVNIVPEKLDSTHISNMNKSVSQNTKGHFYLNFEVGLEQKAKNKIIYRVLGKSCEKASK